MHIWIILGTPVAAIVLLIDFLLRRKKWSNNTRGEKVSLIVNMVSGIPYLILSAYGLLIGITGSSAETALGHAIYNVTLVLAAIYFLVAIAAVIATLILRKLGKIKASIWVNVIAIGYIVVVVLVNYFSGVLL